MIGLTHPCRPSSPKGDEARQGEEYCPVMTVRMPWGAISARRMGPSGHARV
jgi:hypothetical protein